MKSWDMSRLQTPTRFTEAAPGCLARTENLPDALLRLARRRNAASS